MNFFPHVRGREVLALLRFLGRNASESYAHSPELSVAALVPAFCQRTPNLFPRQPDSICCFQLSRQPFQDTCLEWHQFPPLSESAQQGIEFGGSLL